MGTASALLEEAIAAVTDRQNELAGEQEKKNCIVKYKILLRLIGIQWSVQTRKSLRMKKRVGLGHTLGFV